MKIKIPLFFLLFLLVVVTGGYAQNEVKNFFKVGGDIYTAPAHFDKDDLVKLSAAGVGIAGAYFLDKPVKSLFLRNKSAAADFVFDIDKYFYAPGVALAIVSIYSYGAAADDKNTKQLGLRLAEATFYASTIQIASKFIFGRKRPYANCGKFSFDFFQTDISESSFPSAHSTLAFAFSTVMADYKSNSAWKITWYTLASLTAFARVYHNMHWFSDIAAGAALGYFVGEFVINHKTNKESNKNIPVQPVNVLAFKIPL